MRTMIIKLLELLLLILALSCGRSEQAFWQAHTLAQAQSLAAKNSTLIVADFWFEGCGPCRTFARDMEEDPLIKEALRGFVFLSLDIDIPENSDFAQRHHVHAYPTYLVLNANGGVIYSWSGYGTAKDWAKTLSDVLADPITLPERAARFAAQPTFRDALLLGNAAYREGRYQDAEGYHRQATDLDPRAATEEGVPLLIFWSIFDGVGSGQFTIEQAGAYIEDLLGTEEVQPEHALVVAERLVWVRDRLDQEVIIPYLKMAYPHICDLEDQIFHQRREQILIDYALLVEKDNPKAIRLKKQSLPPGWESSPGDLNNFAWWCFENRINLEEAESLSRRSIEAAGQGRAGKESCS